MGTHVRYVEESNGDLTDVLYFCSAGCWTDSFDPYRIGLEDATEGGAAPCAESDSADCAVYCAECGVMMHDPSGFPTPIVVNLIDRPPIDPYTGRAVPVYDIGEPVVGLVERINRAVAS